MLDLKEKTKSHLNISQVNSLSMDLIVSTVEKALSEDIQTGDITAQLVNENSVAKACVITRQPIVVCGKDWVNEVFRQVDPSIKVNWYVNDKDKLSNDDIIFEVEGNARSILTAERSALNFLQMLCGVATKTHQYVDKIKHTNTSILDTRKTIPSFRLAQKYAVFCGGGINHRIGLYDAFLIKENHILACDSITNAVKKARSLYPGKLIEVEVENLDELEEALKACADVIMLDNFSIDLIKKAVLYTDGRAQLEASGNVDLNSIASIAEAGVDFISVGAITKHILAVDLSMRFV